MSLVNLTLTETLVTFYSLNLNQSKFVHTYFIQRHNFSYFISKSPVKLPFSVIDFSVK